MDPPLIRPPYETVSHGLHETSKYFPFDGTCRAVPLYISTSNPCDRIFVLLVKVIGHSRARDASAHQKMSLIRAKHSKNGEKEMVYLESFFQILAYCTGNRYVVQSIFGNASHHCGLSVQSIHANWVATPYDPDYFLGGGTS